MLLFECSEHLSPLDARALSFVVGEFGDDILNRLIVSVMVGIVSWKSTRTMFNNQWYKYLIVGLGL